MPAPDRDPLVEAAEAFDELLRLVTEDENFPARHDDDCVAWCHYREPIAKARSAAAGLRGEVEKIARLSRELAEANAEVERIREKNRAARYERERDSALASARDQSRRADEAEVLLAEARDSVEYVDRTTGRSDPTGLLARIDAHLSRKDVTP